MEVLLRMAETPCVKFNSGNSIRNGFMGFAIKLANLVVKHRTANEMNLIEDSESLFTEDWDAFVNGELENSNERNRRNLGGRQTSATSDDDETNQFDVNMDNIMKRFKCFNNMVQNNSSTDDDDDKDEEEEPAGEPDLESTSYLGGQKATSA